MLTYCRDALIEELERCEYNKNFFAWTSRYASSWNFKNKKKTEKNSCIIHIKKTRRKLKNISEKIPKKKENYLKSKTIDTSVQKNQFKIIKN